MITRSYFYNARSLSITSFRVESIKDNDIAERFHGIIQHKSLFPDHYEAMIKATNHIKSLSHGHSDNNIIEFITFSRI
jgi:hypothetical protein